MRIIHDQTARDLLGNAATLSSELLRDHTDCAVLLDVHGRISLLSRGTLDVLHPTPEETIIGKYWWEMWPAVTQKTLQEAVMRGLAGHITQYWASYEETDGSTTHWDIRLSPVQDDAQAVISVIAVSRQLTAH
jgi:PAS domain S-box-containing protein